MTRGSWTVAIGLLVGAPATAQEYRTRDVGGWAVTASSDARGCFLTRSYDGEGGTTLLLGLDVDGANRLSVLNDNWSIEPKARLTLDFRLSNRAYPRHAAIGMASEDQRGFVTSFDAKFPASFAASRFLHIDHGKVPVERLDLAGSGAAVEELRRCVGVFRAKPVVEPKEKGRKVPKDPFASDRRAKED